MIPKVGKFDPVKGGGFREIARYLLDPHSKATKALIAEDHRHLITTNRVAAWWTKGSGLDGADGALAVAAAMQDVVDRADELKKAAGVSNRGRKATTSPVWTCSYRQRDDAPPLTDDEWRTLIYGSLKAVGLPDGHQVMIAKHVEPSRPDSPDFHVLVNKVSFIDGQRWNCNNDLKKLQSYCDDWDRDRGINHTPERRARIDRVRDWVEQNPDPKNRDRSNPPHRKARLSWAQTAARNTIEKEELLAEVAAKHKDKLQALAAWETEQFGVLRQRELAAKAAAQRDKNEVDRHFSQEKETIMEEAKREERQAAGGWEWFKMSVTGLVRSLKVESILTGAEKQQKAAWQRFFRQEKTAMGRRRNTRMLRAGAVRRGLNVSNPVMLARNPDIRRALLKEISNYDCRAAQKHAEKIQGRSGLSRAERKIELDILRVGHRAALCDIKQKLAADMEQIQADRKAFYAEDKRRWVAFVNEVRRGCKRKTSEIDRGEFQQDGIEIGVFDILLDEPDPGPSTLPGKRRQEAGLENSAEFLAADKKNSPAQENPTALNEYLEWLGVPEGKPQNRLDKAWWAENRLEILEEVEWFESTISEIEDLREAGLENSADDLDVQLWLTRAKRRAGRLWAIGQQEQAEDLEAEIWDVERDNAGPGRGYELPLGPGG